MQEITIHNYESFLLDYFESRLSASQITELKQFILLHPELEIELDADLPVLNKETLTYPSLEELKHDLTHQEQDVLEYFEGLMSKQGRAVFEKKLIEDTGLRELLTSYGKTRLEPTAETFPAKADLFKNEEDYMALQTALLYFEGAGSAEQMLSIAEQLEHDQALQHELSLYQKTRLLPDNSIVFENKEDLKRQALIIPFYRRTQYRSMAAALLLLLGLGIYFQFFLNNSARPAASGSTAALALGKRPVKNAAANKEQNRIQGEAAQKPVLNSFRTFTSKPDSSLNSPGLRQLQAEEEVPVQNLASKSSEESDSLIQTSGLASVETGEIETAMQKYTYMVPFEEEEPEQGDSLLKKPVNKVWHVLARLAKQAHKLGIKSINGNELNDNHYLLSFNAFTIEKK
ncbi:MAG TPA: hypothetical protein PLQ93_07955 [Bacteroidia bacterium]|nr:hypothetical protein [Bacteroidia bacterium]